VDTKRQIHQLCSRIREASFKIQYWDGDCVSYGGAPSEFTVILKDKAVVDKLFGNIRLRLPEAYTAGDIEVEGDLQRFLRLGFLLESELPKLSATEKAKLATMSLWQRNSLARSEKNVAHHYDLGNDFFKLWLDRRMVYSCAYFRRPEDDIDTAQEQKLEHLCAKLRLSPNELLLDIGCGWGAMAIHAARVRGARVVGVTLSEEQLREAGARVAELGLGDRVEIRLQDYREVPEQEGFDKIVSVGMFEHVGREHILDYLRQTARLLKPRGTGVLHTIGRMLEGPVNPWIHRYIFPGLYLPSLAELTEGMAKCDLNVIDVENLRMHYAYTLDRWAAAFEKQVEQVRRMFDERFVRMWRMYLHSSAATFRYGYLNLWQITFTKGLVNDLPLTREHIYAGVSRPTNLARN
jgi:cyclopropane-fatty-acyl-phospholipid synthase